jgi:hypothetical protein
MKPFSSAWRRSGKEIAGGVNEKGRSRVAADHNLECRRACGGRPDDH